MTRRPLAGPLVDTRPVEILGVVSALLTAGLVAVVWVVRQSTLDEAWREAARQLGLAYRPQRLLRAPRLSGKVGTCSVQVDIAHAKSSDDFAHQITRITVTAPSIPPDFEAGPQSLYASLARRLGARFGRRVEDGFDRRVKVDGHPTYALAVLGPDVRRSLQRLATLRGQVQGGKLTVTVRGAVRRAERLISVVEFLTRLGHDLSLPERAWPAALRERAIEDPSAQVRCRSLEVLVHRYADSMQTRQAIRHGLTDFTPEVRLVAARHSGADGVETFADLFYDLGLDPTLRAEALRGWASVAPGPNPGLRRALSAALTSRSDALFRAASVVLVARREHRMRKLVVGALKQGPASIRAAALTALGGIGRPDDAVLAADQLDARDADVRAAAAKAVGRLGALDMVERLLPLTRGLGVPPRVKDAARGAVASIQARAGGDRGRLAVVGDDNGGGGLSEVDGGGGLSEPAD